MTRRKEINKNAKEKQEDGLIARDSCRIEIAEERDKIHVSTKVK